MILKNIIDKKWFKKATIVLVFLFAFSLPLHQKWSTFTLLILVVISLVQKTNKTVLWTVPFLLPPLLYLIMAISLLYSEQMEFRYLEQRASLIAFPIIFSIARLTKREMFKILEYFTWGCFLAIFVCYVNAFYNSLSLIDGELVFKPVINEEFSFLYSVVRDGNYFFSSYFSIFHQSTYFATYLNAAIAVILAFSLWKKNKIYFFFLALFPLVIFQLSSKISIVICGLIFIVYCIYRIKNIRYRGLFLILFFSITTLLIFINPRSRIMIETISERGLKIEPEERYGYNLRLMSWNAAISVIYKNPVFGVGIGDTQREINKVYKKKGYTQPLKENLNTHNQFLQTTIECGALGLFMIILMLTLGFKQSKFNRDSGMAFLALIYFLIITMNFMFESFLNRYSGISFFSFFYYLMITKSED